MTPEARDARAAIESLRSGVPSPHVVAALGTVQHRILEQFGQRLDAIDGGAGCKPLVLEASFGEGKSHLLHYLEHVASERGFVTSYVVIGPDAPLGSVPVVLNEVAGQASAPGRTGRALRELASEYRPESWAELRRWAESAEIDERFRALLHLYEELHEDEEFRVRILDDIGGAPMLKSEITRRLREIGQAAAYDMRRGRRKPELAHDRLRVLAHCCRAFGCRGLVVLFDELEKIARFTLKQRLAAYGELAWWGGLATEKTALVLPVFAVATASLESVIKADEARLQTGFALAEQSGPATAGIRLLKGKAEGRLDPLTREQAERIRYGVRDLYQRAYGVGCSEPAARGLVQRIRSEIRYWITCWDLARYYPEYRADVCVEDVVLDTAEIGDEILPPDEDEG